MSSQKDDLPVIGWREWLALPDLGVPRVKVKVDTGARSSAIHAFDVEIFERRGRRMVRFKIHPLQKSHEKIVPAEEVLHEERWIRSSNGKRELRPVIRTEVSLLGDTWPIELTLTRRDMMGFRMLLGRQAVRGRFVVHPGRSYVGGRPPKKKKSGKKAKKKVLGKPVSKKKPNSKKTNSKKKKATGE